MNPNERMDYRDPISCPRCGSRSSSPFGLGGLCLRCAGVRVLEMESGTPWETPSQDRPLERIGPYEIIEELGHGGMGRVFAARQPGLGRIVAVKTLREGLNPELDLRFLREVQTVAGLRHPNIVAVHDSGRSGGSLYFSMDYIEGGDLAARLRVEPMSPREAAELVAKVADGLAYSHDHGVLHRDLKPSNILLDGKEPMIADFGLAAQIEAGGDLTAATRTMGTPHYLAPEAILGGSASQSVVSDVYSLGVILFEMLTGRTPFAGATSAELPALVSENDPPSVRLLAPAVPRDLETVCLKCIERDPGRRYPSAAALADDLRRFLEGKEILARPASTLYRLRRFERRHRLAVVASGLVALTLVVATGFSLWLAARARRAERKAAAESATSAAVVAFLQHDLLEQAAPDQQPDRDIKLRTLLDRSAAKVADRFKDQPQAELAIRETLSLTYESLGDYASEKQQLDRAVELSTRLLGPRDERTLSSLAEQALILARTGDPKAAEPKLERVIALEKEVLGPDARPTLHATNNLVFVLGQQGRIQDAEAVAKDVAARCLKALGPTDRETLAAEADLSSMYFWEGRYKDAEPLNETVLAAYTQLFGSDNPVTLTSMGNLAAVYGAEDRMDKAQEMGLRLYETRRRVLGPDHPDSLRTLNNLGSAYRQNGVLDKAVEANQASYDGRLKLMGPKSPETLMSQVNLAWAKLEKGDAAGALELAERAHSLSLEALGPDHYATLGTDSLLSEVYRRSGRLAEADQLRTALYQSRLSHGGAENYNTLTAANLLGQVKLEEGDYAAAAALLSKTADAWKKAFADHWRALVCENLLGAAYSGLGRFREAEPLLVESAEGLERRRLDLPVIERRIIREACVRVAAAYTASGQTDRALAWTQRAAASRP